MVNARLPDASITTFVTLRTAFQAPICWRALSRSDPLIYGLTAAVTGVMVLSGTLAPAVRALRVDPVTAVRAE